MDASIINIPVLSSLSINPLRAYMINAPKITVKYISLLPTTAVSTVAIDGRIIFGVHEGAIPAIQRTDFTVVTTTVKRNRRIFNRG